MSKLNQIVAVEKGVKSRAVAEVSELYKVIQKPDLFNGFVKTYQKKDEDGEELPTEKKRVQFVATEVIRSVERKLSELIDITARKDWSNCSAVADVVVDGVNIIQGAPVSFLLFLEKQLTDIRTFIATMPVLDSAESWVKDDNSGLWRTDAITTHRTKKVQRPIVLYPATPEHPAQTQLITEDIISGFWTQIKQSSALGTPAKLQILAKVEALLKAVKEAREAANSIEEVKIPLVSAAIFGYLFGDISA